MVATDDFTALVQAVAARRDLPASAHAPMPEDERRRVLEEWNATEAAYRDGAFVPDLFADTQFPAEAQALLAGLQERSGNRGVDVLLNTHHHGDHTSGNGVFRGIARRVVAHGMADQHMRRPPQPPQQAQQGQQPTPQPQQTQPPPPAPLYPDTTFTHAWSTGVGDERIVARHYGRAHTSGDAVTIFERANVVHMGDLAFHRRHPVVDRAAGASMRNWIRVLEQVVSAHAPDTIYIFGHAGQGLPVTGGSAELLKFRDYLAPCWRSWSGTSRRAARAKRPSRCARRLPASRRGARSGRRARATPVSVAYEEVTTGA